MNLQGIQKILSENIKTSERCRENGCKIDRNGILSVFSPEDGGLQNYQILSEIGTSDGNYKACDCIILCENGDIFIIEILCGKLTESELKDKEKQIENCQKIIKLLSLNLYLKLSFIVYKKRDKNSLSEKVLTGKLPKLQKKGISIRQFNKINKNFPCDN